MILRKLLGQLLSLPFAQKTAIAVSLASFSCCLLLIVIHYQQLATNLEKNQMHLGETLVKQLAINARPALVQGDSLSLQSLLKELTELPEISQSVIFGVDNSPIAEAGKRSEGKAYTAAIHYQDSIAGYGLITLDDSSQNKQLFGLLLQQLLFSLLFVACIYSVSLWLAGKLSRIFCKLRATIKAPNYPENTRRSTISYLADDELNQLISQVTKGPDPKAKQAENVALVHIQFSQNLHQTQHIDELQRYQYQLNTICKLYDGTLSLSRENAFSARFAEKSGENDQPFRALCCAKLIIRLFKDDPLLAPKVGIVTAIEKAPIDYQQMIKQAQNLLKDCQQALAFEPELLEQSSISNLLSATGDGTERADQLNFTSSYQELIDRQLSVLRSQFDKQADNNQQT